MSMLLSEKLSDEHIRFALGKGAWKPAKKIEEVELLLSNIPTTVKRDCIPFIKLLQAECQNIQEIETVRKLDNILSLLSSELSEEEIQLANEAYDHFARQYEKFVLREKLTIPTSIKPILIDVLFKIIVLGLLQAEYITETLFWVTFNLFLPLILIIPAWRKSKKITAHNKELLSHYKSGSKFRLVKHFSETQFFIIFLSLGLQLVILHHLLGFEYLIGTILMALATIALYTFYLQYFSATRLKESSVLKQDQKRLDFDGHLSPDENDELIVDLRSQLKSVSSRLEAYVLESALFGALAFSGFLQIMAENLVSFENLTQFAENVNLIIHNLVEFNFSENNKVFPLLGTKSALFSLVSIETLLCSILFLAVIASRLRFSDIADRIEKSLGLAEAYNAKEEFLIGGELSEEQKLRYTKLNRRIHDQLFVAVKYLDEIEPITRYMRFFRNSGLFTFLIILVSSSLFISGTLAIVFSALAIISLAYFAKDSLLYRLKLLRMIRINEFLNANKWVITLFASEFILGMVAKIVFSWDLVSTILIAFSLLHLGLYRFIYVALAPHIDNNFNQKDHPMIKEWWPVIRLDWGISEFGLAIGVILRIFALPGGSELMVLSGLLMAVSYIFAGIKYVNPGIMRILTIVALVAAFIGVIWKTLHLPFANIISGTGLGLSLVCIFYVIMHRQRVHKFIRQHLIGFPILVLLYYSPFFGSALTMYSHETIKLDEISRIRSIEQSWKNQIQEVVQQNVSFNSNPIIQQLNSDMTWYFDRFDSSYGNLSMHSKLWSGAEYFLELKDEKLSANELANKYWIFELNYKMYQHFDFSVYHSRVIMALVKHQINQGNEDRARAILEESIPKVKFEWFKEEGTELLHEMK